MSTILFIISFIAICVAIVIKIDQDDAKKNEAKTNNQSATNKSKDKSGKSATPIRIIAILIFIAAFIASVVLAPDKPSGSNWDSMSEQEKENARYAYEAGEWMNENGYS